MAVEERLRLGTQLTETLARITEEAAGLLAVEGAGLRLVDGDELVRVATWGPVGGVMARERLRIGESLSGQVAASGQPLILAHTDADPSHDPVYRAMAEQHGFRSWLGVPLRDRERVVGVLVMQSRTEQRFGAADVRLLEAFAGQAAVAIENARLFERERERRRQLEAVREVTLRLAGEMELAPLLELISRLVSELLRVESVAVYLWDETAATLVPRGWHGYPDWLRELRIGPGEGVAGTVAQRRAGLIVDDYRSTPYAHPAVLERAEPRAVIGEPLLYEGELRGVITASIQEPDRKFDEQDRQLLALFAAQAVIAIEHARLHGEAREAVRVRDEFLSVAAHELKTPVTSLLGFAQMLLRQFDRQRSPDERLIRRALQAIEQQSRRLSRLVTELLDLSRLEGGRLVLDRELTDLASLVESVVASLGDSASGHTLVVRASLQVRAPVDPLRLEQVLTNLLDNAIKYSPDGGRIEVELSQPSPETARLAVRDHGIGIPPELRQRIFDRYYQAHSNDHLSGMGLGLYISRQIAELHGGSIRAEFPPDGGSCFILDLPAGSGDTAPSRRAKATR
jgi:signal transduction histidine kinase